MLTLFGNPQARSRTFAFSFGEFILYRIIHGTLWVRLEVLCLNVSYYTHNMFPQI